MTDFSLEYNGVELIPANNYTVYGLNGLHSIDIRTEAENLVDQDGGIIYIQRYAPRIIAIEAAITSGTADQYFQDVKNLVTAFSKTDDYKDLNITPWTTAGVTRKLEAKVITTPRIKEVTGERTVTKAIIQLRADNPFYRDENDTVYGPVGLPVVGGFPLAAPLPMPLGSVSGGTVTVVNSGDKATYASFRLDGELVNPTVTNLTTGENFGINTTINNSDYVEVSFTNSGLIATLNGTTNYNSFLTGTFFDIDPGSHIIRLGASSGNGTMTITFNPEYQNIT